MAGLNHNLQTPLDFFAGQVARYPLAAAVVCGETALTFQALDSLSNRLARLMRAQGVVAGEPVGLLLNKDARAIVTILAAWKLGCPYVPVDIDAPEKRIAHILDACHIRFVVADGHKYQQWSAALLAGRVGLVTDMDEGAAASALSPWDTILTQSDESLPEAASPDDLAYIIFTSGSTGQPKGVMITHRNLAHFIHWCATALDIDPQSSVLNIANFSFDQSVMDLAFMVGCGAELHLFASLKHPLVLGDAIQKQRIQILSAVPTIFGMLFDERYHLSPAKFTSLEKLFIGGAACPPAYVPLFHQKMPGAQVYNMYGPTEVTVYCMYHHFSRTELKNGVAQVPLGQPLPGHQLYLVDERRQPVSGEGELMVCGPQVMRGYWREPAQTRQVFIQPDKDGPPGYLTGDIVKQDGQGAYYFMGRANETIKSGGHRIDLQEIEAAIMSLDAVDTAVAVAAPDSLLENVIVAFIAAKQNQPLDLETIRQVCRENLPGYMLPAQLIFRESLPLNSSGKIDKRQLLAEFQKNLAAS